MKCKKSKNGELWKFLIKWRTEALILGNPTCVSWGLTISLFLDQVYDIYLQTKACCGLIRNSQCWKDHLSLTFLSFTFSFIPLVPGVDFWLLNWFTLGSSHVSVTKRFSFVCWNLVKRVEVETFSLSNPKFIPRGDATRIEMVVEQAHPNNQLCHRMKYIWIRWIPLSSSSSTSSLLKLTNMCVLDGLAAAREDKMGSDHHLGVFLSHSDHSDHRLGVFLSLSHPPSSASNHPFYIAKTKVNVKDKQTNYQRRKFSWLQPN